MLIISSGRKNMKVEIANKKEWVHSVIRRYSIERYIVQSRNESINSIAWPCCPKKIILWVCIALRFPYVGLCPNLMTHFNEGKFLI